MPAMNDPKAVEKQYANANGLNARILLHQKYSVATENYDDWIAKHYRILPDEKVLEVGCGTGSIWRNAQRYLPESASLILTDLSAGMLEAARAAVPARQNILYEQADLQKLPYADHIFDLVIANMMLYHVPDLDKALGEAARVLKPDGRLICATSGENSVGSWLVETLGAGDARKLSFTLQNGEKQLRKFFGCVETDRRQDALRVTNVDDLAAYVLSMTSFSFVREWPYDLLKVRLTQQMVDGVITIPKENGLFQCREPIVTKNFD